MIHNLALLIQDDGTYAIQVISVRDQLARFVYLNQKKEYTASAFSIVQFNQPNVAKYSPILNEHGIIQDVLDQKISYSWNGKEYIYREQTYPKDKKEVIVTRLYDVPVRPLMSQIRDQRYSKLSDKLQYNKVANPTNVVLN